MFWDIKEREERKIIILFFASYIFNEKIWNKFDMQIKKERKNYE